MGIQLPGLFNPPTLISTPISAQLIVLITPAPRSAVCQEKGDAGVGGSRDPRQFDSGTPKLAGRRDNSGELTGRDTYEAMKYRLYAQ